MDSKGEVWWRVAVVVGCEDLMIQKLTPSALVWCGVVWCCDVVVISTIVKQFRLIHNRKLSKQELETISDSLHQNVIDCIRALLQAAVKFGYSLDDDGDRYAMRCDAMRWDTQPPTTHTNMSTNLLSCFAVQ